MKQLLAVVIALLLFLAGLTAGWYFFSNDGGGSTGSTGSGGGAPPKLVRFAGGCFKVLQQPPPSAHASAGDRYCVKEASPGMWVLEPDLNMGDWQKIGGGTVIPLLGVRNDVGTFHAYFDFQVVGHPEPPPGNHGKVHEQPNFRFSLLINPVVEPPAKSRAMIYPTGDPNGQDVHGGTAHADTD